MTSIFEIRQKIDAEGFYIFGTIFQVIKHQTPLAEELTRLGYERFYIPHAGKTYFVFAASGKKPQEAQEWIKTKLPDETPNSFWYLDLDMLHLHVPIFFEFGPGNDNWTGREEHDEFFIRMVQNTFNDVLNARGWVFLNDILVFLGIKPIQAGQLIGWKKGESISSTIPISIKIDKKETGFTLSFMDPSYILDVMEY